MIRKLQVRGLLIAGVAASIGLGYLASEVMRPIFYPGADGGPAVDQTVPPATLWDSGEQIVVALFVSSTCAACQDPALKTHLTHTLEAVKEQASREGTTFVSVGVNSDRDTRRGIEFLDSLAVFDQVSIGAGWANQVALTRLDAGLPGQTAVPELLVYRRTVASRGAVRAGNRRLIVKKTGLAEIEAWSNAGSMLPQQRPAEEGDGK